MLEKSTCFWYAEQVEKRAVVIRLILCIGGMFFVKNYIADIRTVSGISMEPAISDKQFVVIWKLAYGIRLPVLNRYVCRWAAPQAGDVVFYPVDGRYVIKRCVKTEGSMLNFAVEPKSEPEQYGVLRLDTGSVPLNRIQFRNLGGFLPASAQKIPPGFILALGDNAAYSYDSRDYGFVAADSICGKLLWK